MPALCVSSVLGRMSTSIRLITPRVHYSCTMPHCSLGRQSPWRSLQVAVRAQSRAKTGRSRGTHSSVYDNEKMISYPVRYQERLLVCHGKEQRSVTPLTVYCRRRFMHHPSRCSPCAATSFHVLDRCMSVQVYAAHVDRAHTNWRPIASDVHRKNESHRCQRQPEPVPSLNVTAIPPQNTGKPNGADHASVFRLLCPSHTQYGALLNNQVVTAD